MQICLPGLNIFYTVSLRINLLSINSYEKPCLFDFKNITTGNISTIRFMRDEQVPKPILIYMPEDVYSWYGYAAWRFVNGLDMKVYRIPGSLFKDVLDKGLSMQAKMQTAVNVEMTKK